MFPRHKEQNVLIRDSQVERLCFNFIQGVFYLIDFFWCQYRLNHDIDFDKVWKKMDKGREKYSNFGL